MDDSQVELGLKTYILYENVSGSADHPQPVHRQPRHLRPAALHLHHAPHPDGPPHHVLATGGGYGEHFKEILMFRFKILILG